MFKISRYNQLFEDKSEKLDLPSFPSKNLIEEWIGKNRDRIINSEVTFSYKEGKNFKEKTAEIIDVYQDDGHLCLVSQENIPYRIYSKSIEVKEGKINEAHTWEMRTNDYVLCNGNFRGIIGAKGKYAKIIKTRYAYPKGRTTEYYILEFEEPIIDKTSGNEVVTTTIEISQNQVKNLTVIKGHEYERKKAGYTLLYEASKEFIDILKAINFTVPYKFYNMTYFDAGKDSISYIPANKYELVKEDPYKSKYRQESKINRILRQLNDKYTESQIDDFGNKFKAYWKIFNEEIGEERLLVVTGDRIPFWYNCDRYMPGGGTLNSSCMRGHDAQYRVAFYGKHPDKIALCILLDETGKKLVARALIWKLDKPEGVVFMDRIYYVSQVHEVIMKKYAESKNIKTKASGYSSNELFVKLPVDRSKDVMPYLDTMYFRGVTKDGIGYFCNSRSFLSRDGYIIENYHLNESLNNPSSSLALFLTSYFGMMGNNFAKRFDSEFFENYVKSLNIANNNQFVQKVIKDFKQKVSTDPKITNKQIVYNQIDATPIIFRKNDEVGYALYSYSKKDHPDSKPTSWCSTIKPVDPKMGQAKSVIFLSTDASYNEIFHELSHAIEPVVDIDPNLMKMFNFNYNINQQNFMWNLLTKGEYGIKNAVSRIHTEYLKEPGEIYSRLNNLKNFLYKKEYLNSPSQDISEDIMMQLYSGNIYAGLDDKSKEEFRTSDFSELLIFLDINRLPKLRRYVRNAANVSKINF